MFKDLLIKWFGASYDTTIAGFFTVIGAVPSAIDYLKLSETPDWLKLIGGVCMFISFIYMSVVSKSKNVTGVGAEAERKEKL